MKLSILLLQLLGTVFLTIVNAKDGVILVENELVVKMQDEYVVLQTRGNTFYAPILAKISLEKLFDARCYFNAFWNTTVLPVTVDLWRQETLDKIHEDLLQRKSVVCNFTSQLKSPMNNTHLCGRNITVAPTPVGQIGLESDMPHFTSLTVDFTYKRFPPRSVSFALAVPDFANCSELKYLFNQSSFLNTIYLSINKNVLEVEAYRAQNWTQINNSNSVVLWLTNKDVYRVVTDVFKKSTPQQVNISAVMYIRDDYVSTLSSQLAVGLLQNVSVNYVNVELVREEIYRFLCPTKLTLQEIMRESGSGASADILPDPKSTLLESVRTNLLYCDIPYIESPTHYSGSHYYQQRYGYYEKLVHYLKFVLQRAPIVGKMRLPLSV